MVKTTHISRCPVCNNNVFVPLLSCEDWLVTKESFEIEECFNCKFAFTQDPPNAFHAGRYYDNVAYVEHSDSSSGLIFSIYHHARKFMLRFKQRMIKNASSGKKLLDVGSGSGYFLNHMKSSGYEVRGVEISETARKLCHEKFGISNHTPEDFVQLKIEGKYDVITLWHVFEHVYEYDEYFNSFRNYLSKEGKLIIAMPNKRCFEASYYKKYWNGYDTPRHLWHFTHKTFVSFANQRGFSVSKIKKLPLDPFYNSMVSAEYKPSFTFLPFTLLIGLSSYVIGLVSKKRASSLIYILEKK